MGLLVEPCHSLEPSNIPHKTNPFYEQIFVANANYKQLDAKVIMYGNTKRIKKNRQLSYVVKSNKCVTGTFHHSFNAKRRMGKKGFDSGSSEFCKRRVYFNFYLVIEKEVCLYFSSLHSVPHNSKF